MTTATCTCGAIHFDGARHVNDCPAGNPMQCDCGAVNYEGAAHKVTCPMISATHSAYVPPQPPQNASQGQQRRKVEDTGGGGPAFLNLKFQYGVPLRAVEFHDSGEAAAIEAGSVIGTLVDYRVVPHETYGDCGYADLEIRAGEYAGLRVSFRCGTPPNPSDTRAPSSMLARLIPQVRAGELIEITRERDRGRAHVYTVEVIE